MAMLSVRPTKKEDAAILAPLVDHKENPDGQP